jgi:hypothetical protein
LPFFAVNFQNFNAGAIKNKFVSFKFPLFCDFSATFYFKTLSTVAIPSLKDGEFRPRRVVNSFNFLACRACDFAEQKSWFKSWFIDLMRA